MALTLSLAPLAPAHTEQALVGAARHGDDRAFEELYSRYRERIGAFILAKVHDHGRAEDIAQEVFISALRRLRSSDQAIAFKPWIYEIAKNACIDEFRRFKRTREVSLDADEELGSGSRGLLSLAAMPPAAVESKQRLDDLQGAFGGLSESHHKLLVMREFEGLSYTEIGARTGMSRQVVESTLFRARRKLTEEYDEIASGRRCEQVMAMIAEGRAQSLRSCGVRQRRQLTRHLAHCQPCRREARLAGVDESFVKPRSVAAKIAALLPFPVWRWPWGGHGAGKGAAAKAGSASAGKGAAAKVGSAGAGSLQSAATTIAGTAGQSITLGQAAAAMSALVIAGGGAVTGVWSGNHTNHPVKARAVSSSAPGASVSAAGVVRGGLGAAGLSAAKAHRAGAATRAASHQPRRLSHSGHAPAGGGGAATKPRQSTGARRSPGVTGTSSPRPAGTQATGSGSGSAASSIPSKVTGTANSTASGVRKIVKSVAPSAPVRSKVGSTAQKVTAAVGATTQKVTSAVGATTQKVTSAVGATTQKVTSAAGGAASQLGSTANSTTDKVTSTLGNTASQLGAKAKGTTETAAFPVIDVTSKAESAMPAATDAAEPATSAAPDGASSLVP